MRCPAFLSPANNCASRRAFVLRLLLCAAAGALNVLAFEPFGLYPLPLLTLGVLVACLRCETRTLRAFALGFAWGWTDFVVGVGWLGIALHRFGGMWLPFTVLAVSLFCAWLALFPALASAVFVRLQGNQLPGARAALLFGSCWALGEWLRGTVFTGFPWLAIGYSQATGHGALDGWFALIGAYGVGALVAALAAACVHLRTRFAALAIAAVCAAGLAAEKVEWTQPDGAPLEVSLLQPNVEQSLKWDPDLFFEWLDRFIELAYQHPARLIVLPESALPVFEDQLTDSIRNRLRMSALGQTLLVGVFLRNEQQHAFNSAITYGEGEGQRYGKHHLVPFGEYSPPLFGWFYQLIHIPMSDQTPAPARQAPIRVGTHRIALNICYENLFGHEIARNALDAGILLNLSNLSWYGSDSLAQAQHLQIGRARALETARPYLSGSNDGMTAALDPHGRTLAALAPATMGALTLPVQATTGQTPYLRLRDWPALATALALLILCPGTARLRRLFRRGNAA